MKNSTKYLGLDPAKTQTRAYECKCGTAFSSNLGVFITCPDCHQQAEAVGSVQKLPNKMTDVFCKECMSKLKSEYEVSAFAKKGSLGCSQCGTADSVFPEPYEIIAYIEGDAEMKKRLDIDFGDDEDYEAVKENAIDQAEYIVAFSTDEEISDLCRKALAASDEEDDSDDEEEDEDSEEDSNDDSEEDSDEDEDEDSDEDSDDDSEEEDSDDEEEDDSEDDSDDEEEDSDDDSEEEDSDEENEDEDSDEEEADAFSGKRETRIRKRGMKILSSKVDPDLVEMDLWEDGDDLVRNITIASIPIAQVRLSNMDQRTEAFATHFKSDKFREITAKMMSQKSVKEVLSAMSPTFLIPAKPDTEEIRAKIASELKKKEERFQSTFATALGTAFKGAIKRAFGYSNVLYDTLNQDLRERGVEDASEVVSNAFRGSEPFFNQVLDKAFDLMDKGDDVLKEIKAYVDSVENDEELSEMDKEFAEEVAASSVPVAVTASRSTAFSEMRNKLNFRR